MTIELLAPAGEPDSGYAALHYGADAIYLGLSRFSARAEAVNFSLTELDEIVAYAHSLPQARKVYVTVNTVIHRWELTNLVRLLGNIAELNVDAAIVQDLGVARIIRRHFPSLRLHGSTQMAIHNRAGAAMLRELGYDRVTLARELTMDEVRDIAANGGIEVECFVQGALCYSYSGLCMFSSMESGRSGNRGRCSYSCREMAVKEDGSRGFPFSMKDLTAAEFVGGMKQAGVSSLKIEGRKKSPLYVSTAAKYYRGLIDGSLTTEEAAELAADMQTVFSRPTTSLFLASRHNRKTVDLVTVGHLGAELGTVENIAIRQDGTHWLRFTTSRAVERHDGLQIDLAALGRPFGFPVNEMLVLAANSKTRAAGSYECNAGDTLEVALPDDHPEIPRGSKVYHASSQAVKRNYKYEKPKPGLHRNRRAVDIEVRITPERVTATGQIVSRGADGSRSVISAEPVELAGKFDPARDEQKMATAARGAFEKLGDTRLSLKEFSCVNPQCLFVPVSMLNELRRMLCVSLENALQEDSGRNIGIVLDELEREENATVAEPIADEQSRPVWSLKIDRAGFIDAFDRQDWETVDRLIIDIGRDPADALDNAIEKASEAIGREKIVVALPIVTRAWEEEELRSRIRHFSQAGCNRWQISNLGSLHILKEELGSESEANEISSDWPLYAFNAQAVLMLLEMGMTSVTLSPDNERDNICKLLQLFGDRIELIAYQDTPLFISESCPTANFTGACAGENCSHADLALRMESGKSVLCVHQDCRSITIGDAPFSLSGKLGELLAAGAVTLRADFIWKPYSAEEVRGIWRKLRNDENIPNSHCANFDRGML